MDKVINLLRNSISQSTANRDSALSTSLELESSEPFLIPICLHIYDSADDAQLQFLAVCWVKNIIGRLWSTMSIDSKSQTKTMLVDSLQKPSVLYLREIVLIICRIAKYELPNQWPALVDFLFTSTHFSHYPFVLKQIVKQLDSRKIGRREIKDLADRLFHLTIPVWRNPNYTPIEEIDSAILILAKISCDIKYMDLVKTYIVQRWKQLLEKESDEKTFRKFMKHFANLFSSRKDEFGDVISMIGDLAIKSLDSHQRLRLYAVSILCDGIDIENFLVDFSIVLEKVIRCAICIDVEDVEEWLSNPLDSIRGGPLDGSELRESGLDLVSKITKKLDIDLSSIFPRNDYQLLDAFYACMIHSYPATSSVVTCLTLSQETVFTFDNNPFKTLFAFRYIKLLQEYIVRDLPQSQIGDMLELLLPRIGEPNPTCVRAGAIFAIKSIYDKFHDNPIWEKSSRIFSELIDFFSKIDDSELVQWRVLNFATLLLPYCPVSEIAMSQLVTSFLKSKSEMVKIAVIEFFSACVSRNMISTCLRIVDDSVGHQNRSYPGHRVSSAKSSDEVVEHGLCLLKKVIEVCENEDRLMISPYISVVLRLWEKQLEGSKCSFELIECICAFNCCGLFNSEDLRIETQLTALQRSLNLMDHVPDCVVDSCLELVGIISVKLVGTIPISIVIPLIQSLSTKQQDEAESMGRLFVVLTAHMKDEMLFQVTQHCVSYDCLLSNLGLCFDATFVVNDRILILRVMCELASSCSTSSRQIILQTYEVVKKQITVSNKRARMTGTQRERMRDSLWFGGTDLGEMWNELETRIVELTK